MNLREMIERLRVQRAAKMAERARITESLAEIRAALGADDTRELTAEEQQRISTGQTARAALDAEIAAQTAQIDQWEAEQRADDAMDALARESHPTGAGSAQRTGGAMIGNEARVYEPGSSQRGRSFFADAFAAQRGDWQAQDRLRQHGAQVEVDIRASGQQSRAISTSGVGSLVVPQYLPEMFAPALRAGRPFANAVTHLPLPSEGMSITLPRLTTATAAAVQTAQNTVTANTDAVVTDLTIPVCTIAGASDVSRQTLERGQGVDELLYADLAGAYASALDNALLVGTGTGGQPLGALNTAGVIAQTAYGALVTISAFYSKVAGAIQAVTGQGVGVNPQLIVMHPRRWGWLTAQLDTAGRPLVVPLANGAYNAEGLNLNPGAYGGGNDVQRGYTVVGSMHGLPVVTDSNMPTTKGAGLEDVVLITDPTKLYLWEDGDGMPRQLQFEQTLGANLTTKLIIYSYVAFTAGRYPGATSTTGGVDVASQGLQPPSF